MKLRCWAWVVSVVLWAGCASPSRMPADSGTGIGEKPEVSQRALRLWLRADQGVVARDGKVSRWKDQSGGGRDGIMNHGPRQPSLELGALNDRPAVHFAGSQSLHLQAPVGPTAFTVPGTC